MAVQDTVKLLNDPLYWMPSVDLWEQRRNSWVILLCYLTWACLITMFPSTKAYHGTIYTSFQIRWGKTQAESAILSGPALKWQTWMQRIRDILWNTSHQPRSSFFSRNGRCASAGPAPVRLAQDSEAALIQRITFQRRIISTGEAEFAVPASGADTNLPRWRSSNSTVKAIWYMLVVICCDI